MRIRRPDVLLLLVISVSSGLVAACRTGEAGEPGRPSAVEQLAIEDTIKRTIERAYDFGGGDNVARLMSLYPDSGRILSAVNGRVTTNRDSLRADIVSFWDRVGQNMREPRWVWGKTYVDAITRDAAVFTGTYTIPHRTPAGAAHVVGGAWTALFVKRGGRWVIVQEHLSDLPVAVTDSAAAAQPVEHQHH